MTRRKKKSLIMGPFFLLKQGATVSAKNQLASAYSKSSYRCKTIVPVAYKLTTVEISAELTEKLIPAPFGARYLSRVPSQRGALLEGVLIGGDGMQCWGGSHAAASPRARRICGFGPDLSKMWSRCR